MPQEQIDAVLAQNEQLLQDNAALKKQLALLSEILRDTQVGMQAATIEAHHNGAPAGMRWIVGALVGPGLLPSADEPWYEDAQLYYNANCAKPFAPCEVCEKPSGQLWMGHSACSAQHMSEIRLTVEGGK